MLHQRPPRDSRLDGGGILRDLLYLIEAAHVEDNIARKRLPPLRVSAPPNAHRQRMPRRKFHHARHVLRRLRCHNHPRRPHDDVSKIPRRALQLPRAGQNSSRKLAGKFLHPAHAISLGFIILARLPGHIPYGEAHL